MLELAKFFIGEVEGVEIATAFPASMQHADVWRATYANLPSASPKSAGFFYDEPSAEGPEVLWCGGSSDTMQLDSRPNDGAIIQQMLRSQVLRQQNDIRLQISEQQRRAGMARRRTVQRPSMSFR